MTIISISAGKREKTGGHLQQGIFGKLHVDRIEKVP